MAQRPKFRKSSTLSLRIMSAVLLIPLSLYIIYMGPPYSLILGGLVAAGLFIEWIYLCVKNKLPWYQKVIVVIFGTAYLVLTLLYLFIFLSLAEYYLHIYWLLFLVWSIDIAAYIGGKLLKGPKLAPSISPYKTWSGFFSGMVVGTIVGYSTSFWLVPDVFSFLGIVLLVLIAQAGDLLESKAKRWSNVKDSSFLIPGHGGLLDRLDSLLAVSFAVAFWEMLKA